MHLHQSSQHNSSAARQPPDAATCETRKLGDTLIVCMAERHCPFALPFGNLFFCRKPSFRLAEGEGGSADNPEAG